MIQTNILKPAHWSGGCIINVIVEPGLTVCINWTFTFSILGLKVEYNANQNSLKHCEKIAYVDQRFMYPMIKKNKLYHAIVFF